MYPYLVWLNRSSPLLSAEAALRRLGFSHLGTLRQCVFRFNSHRAGETVGIFVGAALLRMQYICCRYPQTRSTPRTDGLRPATFFQETRYIGEVGLDFVDKTHKAEQLSFFSELIERCRYDGSKILTIHSRQAVKEVLEIIGHNFRFKPIYIGLQEIRTRLLVL